MLLPVTSLLKKQKEGLDVFESDISINKAERRS